MFSDSEATRFNTLLNEMAFVERNLQSGKAAELAPEDVPDSLRDLVIRVIGARTGSQVAQTLGMTGSIQVPGFFAQEARNRFIYMPKKYMGDLLVQAAEDPKLMSLIIARGVEGQTNNQKISQIHQRIFFLTGFSVGEENQLVDKNRIFHFS